MLCKLHLLKRDSLPLASAHIPPSGADLRGPTGPAGIQLSVRRRCLNTSSLMLALKYKTAGPLLRLPSVKREYVFHVHWLLQAFPLQVDRRRCINIMNAHDRFESSGRIPKKSRKVLTNCRFL